MVVVVVLWDLVPNSQEKSIKSGWFDPESTGPRVRLAIFPSNQQGDLGPVSALLEGHPFILKKGQGTRVVFNLFFLPSPRACLVNLG